MTAQTLPPRPDLEQLKRQAKELLKRWQIDPSARPESKPPRLRDAQRAVAAEYRIRFMGCPADARQAILGFFVQRHGNAPAPRARL